MRGGFKTSIQALVLGTGLTLAHPSALWAQGPSNSPPAGDSRLPAGGEASGYPTVVKGPALGGPIFSGDVAAPPVAGPADCLPGDEPYRLWVAPEYLLWHIKDPTANQISLINTFPVFLPAPVNTTAMVSFQNTSVFPQGLSVNDGERSGARLTAGLWCDDEKLLGFEANFFALEHRTISSDAQQSQQLQSTPFLATFSTVVTTTTNGTTTSQLVTQTVPGTFTGQLVVDLHSAYGSRLWGGEVDARSRQLRIGALNLDILGGFRYVDLTETLNYNGTITVIPSGQLNNGANTNLVFPTSPSTATFFDSFGTRNTFYGPQLGLGFDIQEGRVFLEGAGKIALGEMHQAVNIAGGGIPFDATGLSAGALTQPADLGHHSRERFSVVLEPTVNLGYQFTPHIRAFVGYNLLFLENVARPGAQIGVSQTTTQVSLSNVAQTGNTTAMTIRQPAFQFSEEDIFVQGANFGLEFRY